MLWCFKEFKTFEKGLKMIPHHPKHITTVVFDIAGEVWRGAGGVCCYTGYHQCPDSSPAANNTFDIFFDVLCTLVLSQGVQFFYLWSGDAFSPFWRGFSPFRLVMGSQSGIGCSNELANFLSTSRGGDIRMIKVGCDHCIVWGMVKMCSGSNIFICHSCTGAGKQVGGFWELGGRLGGPGF